MPVSRTTSSQRASNAHLLLLAAADRTGTAEPLVHEPKIGGEPG